MKLLFKITKYLVRCEILCESNHELYLVSVARTFECPGNISVAFRGFRAL